MVEETIVKMVNTTAVFTFVVGVIGLPVLGCLVYLLGLLAAASVAGLKSKKQQAGVANDSTVTFAHAPRVVVIVPAHNEEQVLAATLDSLSEQDYSRTRYEVVVVSDNSTDSTATIAREYGARVLERFNAEERGKGYALDWAISQLLNDAVPADAFVIVDADTWVAPDFLGKMADRLVKGADERGCCAVQGRYGVLNGADGWRAALMAGAFDLYNHVRPLGCSRLGLTVSLKGNGMGFTREVFQLARWQGNSVTEDVDYGLDLIRNHGICVGYLPEARVLAQMPVTAGQAASQRERWEGGRYRLLRDRAIPLLKDGIRRRSVRLCDAALSLVLPPLSELVAMLLLWGCLVLLGARAHVLAGTPVWGALFAASMVGLILYVIGGLSVAGAPRSAYLALFKAPFYAMWKFALYLGRFVRHRNPGQTEWVRTQRLP